MKDKSKSIGNGCVTTLLIVDGIVIISLSNDGSIGIAKIIGFIHIAAGCILLYFNRLTLSYNVKMEKERNEAFNLIIEEYLRNKDRDFLKYIVSKSGSEDIDDLAYGYLTSDYDAPKNEIEVFYREGFSKVEIAAKVMRITNKILKEDDLNY